MNVVRHPVDGDRHGALVLDDSRKIRVDFSRNLTGADSSIPFYFRGTVLGVSNTGSPVSVLEPIDYALGAPVLGAQPWLPTMTLANLSSRGIGLDPLSSTEELYRFEECLDLGDPDDPYDNEGCFGLRPPYDPLIGVRLPVRTISEFARTVGFSYQFEDMDYDEAMAVLAAVFEYELGVARP